MSRWCSRCCCCLCTKPECCYYRISLSPLPFSIFFCRQSPSPDNCRARTLHLFVRPGQRHCAPQSGSHRQRCLHQWHPSSGPPWTASLPWRSSAVYNDCSRRGHEHNKWPTSGARTRSSRETRLDTICNVHILYSLVINGRDIDVDTYIRLGSGYSNIIIDIKKSDGNVWPCYLVHALASVPMVLSDQTVLTNVGSGLCMNWLCRYFYLHLHRTQPLFINLSLSHIRNHYGICVCLHNNILYVFINQLFLT